MDKRSVLPWALVLIAVIATGVLSYLLNNALRGKRIAESNEKAALDTTRISLVGDLSAASRLLEQKDIRIRTLGGALEASLRERRADARLVQGLLLQIDSLNNTLAAGSDSTDSMGVRVATFQHTGPPIEGTQIVHIPPLPHDVLLESHLQVTPFSVRYGLGCDKSRTPVASFETPTWVRTTFEKGTVDSRICNPRVPFFSLNLRPTLGNLIYGVGSLIGGILLAK